MTLEQLFSSKGINYKASFSFLKGNYHAIYIQNKLDNHHWQNHFLPFLSEIGLDSSVNDSLLCQVATERVTLVMSDKWGNGHSAAPKSFIFGLLNLLLNDVQGDELNTSLERLHSFSKSALHKCSLNILGNRFIARVYLADQINIDASNLQFAWYLYKDGVRIETKPYSNELDVRFETSPEPGKHWVVVFARGHGVKQSMRSNKNYGI